MTHLAGWTIDPFDIVWKNLNNVNSTFTTFQEKINYPVDIYEVETGLCFELAVVGLDKKDVSILTEGDVLRVSYDKPESEEHSYIQKGITRRSFDLAWKIASKFNLSKLDAKLDKGLLIINIPFSEEKAPKKIEIK
jgi:HSP20 family molecular chaperone IbpA